MGGDSQNQLFQKLETNKSCNISGGNNWILNRKPYGIFKCSIFIHHPHHQLCGKLENQ